MIHDYLLKLINTSINQSEFINPIQTCFEEFSKFISKFELLNSNKENLSELIHFEFIKKCELPSNNKLEINSNRVNKTKIMRNNEKYLMTKIDMENYNTTKFENNTYENKKNLTKRNFKPKDDKIKIMNDINLTGKEKILIAMEGTLIEKKSSLKIENNKKILLTNDSTSYYEEIFNRDYIDKFFEDKNNIAATKFLRDIMKIVEQKNQKYSIIRDKNKIKDLIQKFDDSTNQNNFDFYINYSKYSSRLQNIISNLIREKVLIFNENQILPKTLENSYLDILVDISATMSEVQRVASLLICTGLSLSFSNYGVKIRISIFAERDCVWLLTDVFSLENVKQQLSRLRDALSLKKRFLSFPADALMNLKNAFYENNNKYCQVLISNLISSQIVDKKLNWDEIGQRIIVFGLKSNFEEQFKKENPNIYENILKIPTNNPSQIIQEFFEPSEIISQFYKIDDCSKLIGPILDTLLNEKEKIEDFKIRDIFINCDNYPQNQLENDIESLKISINNKYKDQKYFAQNKPFSMISLSKFKSNNIQFNSEIPSLSELEKLTFKNNKFNKNDSLEEIISFIKSLLTPIFLQILPSNFALGKIPCTSGGSLSIQGVKKWICSGFTYNNIFEKQDGKNKKKYNISFVFDLSSSALLYCNYSHCIATIILLLIAPSTVEDNEDIFIDVIINTINGIKIVDFNSKCEIFQNILKINEIINIINVEVNNSCCPGSCIYAAYQLLLERREDKKIFLITDGFVTEQNEIEFVLHLIEKCENEGIELITIGVGTFPKGIDEIYPNCCYCPSIKNLQEALFSCIFYPNESVSNSFEQNLIVVEFNKNIKETLTEILNKEPKDKR